MNLSCTHEVLTNWRRPDMEGDSGDASVIENVLLSLKMHLLNR
jgi:hypothetical protein